MNEQRPTKPKKTPITELTAGAILGELSFIDKLPASATAEAVSNSKILAIPHQTLRTTTGSPQFTSNISTLLSGRLRNTTNIFLTEKIHSLQYKLQFGSTMNNILLILAPIPYFCQKSATLMN